MIITKGNSVYTVADKGDKWTIRKDGGKLTVEIDIPKELCNTENDLREYVFSNDLF